MSIPSRPSFSDDSRITKPKKPPLPKSLLLKDYLLEDMSSCSSNGFRSYPRRQCCTTVRFLVESDLNKHTKLHRQSNFKPKPKPKPKPKHKQSSMLQRASSMMIHVLKRLPLSGIRVSSKVNVLPRSLSRKLLKHGLWKNSDDCKNNEVNRLKSFGELLKEEEISRIAPSPSLVLTASMTELTRNNNIVSGNSSGVDLGRHDDVVDGLVENKVTMERNEVGATTTGNNDSDSTGNAKKWHDEQFSPVSVMDFPSDNDNDDDDDEVSSMYTRKHPHVKGAKLSWRKTRISDRVTQLEPVKLEDRIAQSVLKSPTRTLLDVAQEENQIEKKAMALLQLTKATLSSHHSLGYEVVETVLLEFFKEGALEENVSDYEMLQRAKDWINGQEQDIFIDWECNNNREAYLRDMEKGVKWSNYDHQLEKVNVGLEVECEIFDSLINDLLIEFNLVVCNSEDYYNFR